ncbi:Steroid 5 alpha-reductase 3 [Entophlyctis luteolus]|nr:Steroid 5 alpha-reductase 3 [Entophlyctis luteolus]
MSALLEALASPSHCACLFDAAVLVYFAAVSVAAVAAQWLLPKSPLAFVVQYGKTLPEPPRGRLHLFAMVPKSWFVHFYIVGSLVSSCVLLATLFDIPTLRRVIAVNPSSPSDASAFVSLLLVAVMELSQSLRRLYESLYISRFASSSRIHVAQYLHGIAYYVITPLAATLNTVRHIPIEATGVLPNLSAKSIVARHVAAVALFVYASIQQFKAHRQLAALRSASTLRSPNKKTIDVYSLPKAGWFAHAACPHYFFEVLIYLAILCAGGGGMAMWAVVAGVSVELSAVADSTRGWYLDRFAKHFAEIQGGKKRSDTYWRLAPGVF